MNYYFKWKLPKSNKAIFVGEDGSIGEMQLNVLYQIIPFIQLGDCGTIAYDNNGKPKFILMTEDQDGESALPAKRKRGRPRKPVDPNTPVKIKGKRGRPKKKLLLTHNP